MQVPIVAPSPVVEEHSPAFRDLFENHCQYSHFQNYLTGLMVLSNKTLSNISRCLLDSSDKTNLSRFFSQAPWLESEVNDRRIEYMMTQTTPHRLSEKNSYLLIDDTLCEHVGSLFEYVARYYDHCDGGYPLAHNLITSHYVSGAVRFPLDAQIYRRYEEYTDWESFVKKHFPDAEIPKKSKERNKFHKEVLEQLLKDEEFKLRHDQFQTKIKLATCLIEKAVERGIAFSVVLIDSWYLSPELVEVLNYYKKDWVSLLKKNRNLETESFTLRDEKGEKIELEGPHIKVEDMVKLIPASAYRLVKIGERDYWCFAMNLRVPSLGRVRIVISYENEELKGRYAVLLTNRTDWSAKKILETYLRRWPIETFYQDSKGHLGLDEYRMRSAEAIKKHWCLVFVAYSLLHLECLAASPRRMKAALKPIKTIGEACRQQGQAVIEKLILYAHNLLERGEPASEVFASLFAKQRAVAGT